MLGKFSVKKPFTVLVGVVLVIVLGVVSLMRMTTDLLPDMSFEYAMVITTDPGASPEKIESEVTSPIESAMATTSNIKNVTSTSYNSYSIVTCEYEQGANMDSIVIEMQQKLDQLEGNWDETVGTPTIMQINPDMIPILMAGVDKEGMNRLELSNYVSKDLIPALESVEGVANVTATGLLEESVQVTMDQDKIDALNKKIKKDIDSQFKKPQKKIDKAKKGVDSGKKAMTDGSDQMKNAVDQAMSKRDELVKSQSDLEKKLADLKKQQTAIKTVQDGLNSFMSSEQYKQLASMDSGIKDLKDGVVRAQEGAQSLQDNIAAMKKAGQDTTGMEASLQQMQAQIPKLQQQLTQLEQSKKTADAAIKKQFAGLKAMGITVNGYADLPAASAKIGKLATQINTGVTAMETAMEQIKSGKTGLSDAIDSLNANAALAAIQMAGKSSDLASAAASLESAQSSLDQAKSSAKDSADLNTVLTKESLSGILTAQNFDMPAGYAYEGDTRYLIHVGEAVKSVDELKDLILMDMKMDHVGIIRLKDVADIDIADNSAETYTIINGNPGVALSMEKQTGYSTGEVTDRVLQKFEQLEKGNQGLHLTTLMNQGVYIGMVVDSVVQNMIVGAILAIFVLILFLKDVKPTLVIACSIPLSVIASIVLMYFTGITLNIISLSGLTLGIGMLVDNSIVVIENIYRLRGEGLSVRKAAVEGAGQVAGAIIASTLTTISVYAPIIFTKGITRQLFMDLALTIAYTLLASLIMALTFVPAMSSGILKKTREIRHPWFEKFKEGYGRFLELCLRFKPLVFILSILLLVGSGAAALSKGMGFMDMKMESGQLSVKVSPKKDVQMTFGELTNLSDQVLEKISNIEGIDTIAATAGGTSTMNLMNANNQTVNLYLLLDEESSRTTDEISAEIQEKTKDVNGIVETNASSMDYTSYFGEGLSVRIKGSDLQTLQELAKKTAAILGKTEGVTDVEDGLDNTAEQLTITVDKKAAAKYGYTVAQVFQLVSGQMADSKTATTISTDLKDYKVYLRTQEQSETKLSDIKNLTFTYKNKKGKEKEYPLTKICKMENETTLSTITRDAQSRFLTVSGKIDEGHNITLVSDQVKDEIKKMDVPEGYTVTMEGEDQTINESMEQMMEMLLLAVIFIYLIMVAQFQSLLSPFIIMFSIPLAFTGGFIALFITGSEVSIIAMLGFIMLAGLIVNNGIVLIDYINQARRQGASKHEAIISAGKIRVRPILMTVLTTILAMSTTALGIGGDNADMMKPMAVTIIGGLLYGTVLTLIVIPCIYDAFNREKSMVEEEL